MLETIKALDDDLMADVVGVAQALGQLRKALDKVDDCLDKRQFSEASSLGYNDVASEFIFLQRVLGALQESQHQKEKLVQDIAVKASCSYEEAFPFLDKHLVSSKPIKSDLKRLDAMRDDEIDHSEIPEFDESFWEKTTAKLAEENKKKWTVC